MATCTRASACAGPGGSSARLVHQLEGSVRVALLKQRRSERQRAGRPQIVVSHQLRLREAGVQVRLACDKITHPTTGNTAASQRNGSLPAVGTVQSPICFEHGSVWVGHGQIHQIDHVDHVGSVQHARIVLRIAFPVPHVATLLRVGQAGAGQPGEERLRSSRSGANRYYLAMAYPVELLSKDEDVALDLRPHWATMLRPGLMVLPALAAVIGTFFFLDRWPILDWIALGLLVASLAYFAWHWVIWNNTQFVVTNERVISRVGVISKTGVEIPLDQISAVTFNQTIIERLVGAGDLGIESSSDGGVQNFSNVRKPNKVQQEIYRMTELLEERRVTRMGQAVSSATAPTASIPEQIQQLDALRQSGALTEEEFQTSKAALLRQL